jgi:membrane-associated phospholipid phosphatase
MTSVWKRAYTEVRKPRRFIGACLIGIALCVAFPTDYGSYPPADTGQGVYALDHYVRFVNTAAQVALPLLLADKIGMVQLVYVGISTTLATHGLKRIVDRWQFWDARVGQRPSGPGSRYNMPSGHSSMASCAAYFVGRRYSWWHLLYLIPILLLTMYARVALDAHTVAAVIAGALIGLAMAAIFTSRRQVPAA